MTQSTLLAEYLETAAEKAMLDEVCKRLLADKIILAWIMRYALEEYGQCDIEEIADRYIEGNPIVAQVSVHQDVGAAKTGSRIIGEDTIDKTITEGTVTFDIRFRAIAPQNGEFITLIINIEAQNDFYPGYPLVKRGIYYCCRMVSGQYGVEFQDSQYDKINNSTFPPFQKAGMLEKSSLITK